jgi:hypothetical protein
MVTPIHFGRFHASPLGLECLRLLYVAARECSMAARDGWA